jgi:hypothetical protein
MTHDALSFSNWHTITTSPYRANPNLGICIDRREWARHKAYVSAITASIAGDRMFPSLIGESLLYFLNLFLLWYYSTAQDVS